MTIITLYRLGADHASLNTLPANERLEIGFAHADYNLDQDPDTRLQTYRIEMARKDTDNAAPIVDESRKPDTGFAGIRYILNLYFDQEFSTGVQRLVTWNKDSSTVPGHFRNGRFGINISHTYSNLPQNPTPPSKDPIGFYKWPAGPFDIHPTKDIGLKLVRIEYDYDHSYRIAIAKVILEQSGKADQIGNVDTRYG